MKCFGKNLIAPLVVCILEAASARAADNAADAAQLGIIPWPKSVQLGTGQAELTAASRIVTDDARLQPLAAILAEEIELTHVLRLPTAMGAAKPGDIRLQFDPKPGGENYALTVAETTTVAGGTYNSIAQGTVTLLQSLRHEKGKLTLPRMTITDGPHFPFCGAMIDIARKPHSIETLKQCVLAARFYKVRFIQLHMSDENAWTFPSTAYPQLGSTNFAWAGGDKPEVYKLNELKELVAFADARAVTFIPELETPGHSAALRGSLPEVFGYLDDKGKITSPGMINMCTEKAYQTLDTLVGEMSEVFKSSPYFHIGCDEAGLPPEDLPEVKAWVAKHNLPKPYGAAVFGKHVQLMDEIVKKHGKRMIIWEGAPIDPVAPPKDVIFMPWVGGVGFAAECVKRGYAVINPPWGTKKEYFDPFDVNGAQLSHDEPLLLGASSLSWQAVQENALPFMRYRTSLRNEPTYNPDAMRGIEDFLTREVRTDMLLDKLLCGFAIKAEGGIGPLVFNRPETMFTKKLNLTLDASPGAGTIRYTLDGSEPTDSSPALKQPITLDKAAQLRARAFDGAGKPRGYAFSREYRKVTAVAHEAIGAKVTFNPENPGYFGPGPKGLTDGVLAAGDSYGDPGWVGWAGNQPITVTLDLGKPTMIRDISPRSIRGDGGLNIPKEIDFLLSNDGTNFRSVAKVGKEFADKHHGWYRAELKRPEQARFVRVVLTPSGEWTFLDEVAVNGTLPGPNLVHAAIGKTVTLTSPPSDSYAAAGIEALTDGYIGFTAHCSNVGWLGWENKNIEAVIDLGKPTELGEVGGHFQQYLWAGVYMPGTIDILVSDDGKTFKDAAKIGTPASKEGNFVKILTADLKNLKARYVKIAAHTNGMWLFTDELIVNPAK